MITDVVAKPVFILFETRNLKNCITKQWDGNNSNRERALLIVNNYTFNILPKDQHYAVIYAPICSTTEAVIVSLFKVFNVKWKRVKNPF